jgi:hypothetical protein
MGDRQPHEGAPALLDHGNRDAEEDEGEPRSDLHLGTSS